MRNLSEIIVHCTATKPDFMPGRSGEERVAEIKRWHVEGNGWSDIGYHYLIDRDGRILEGRPISRTGAHVKGRNTGSVGVSLFGGHGSSENDKFPDNFTDAQEAALRWLIGDLKAKYGNLKVTGHNQYAAKACPGFYVPEWLEGDTVAKVPQTPEQVLEIVADADKSPAASTTNWGAALALLASGYQWWQSQDVYSQAVTGAVVLLMIWIMRERIRKAKVGKLAKEALGL